MMLMKRSFKPGQPVYHARLGRGIIIQEWGDWLAVDERGNALSVNGRGVYEVQFKTGRTLSVNRWWLALGPRAVSTGAKPVWQLT